MEHVLPYLLIAKIYELWQYLRKIGENYWIIVSSVVKNSIFLL